MSKKLKKEMFDGSTVEILGETYEPGPDRESYNWRENMVSRDEQVKYLKNGERYWYSPPEDLFGSEKRKKPA